MTLPLDEMTRPIWVTPEQYEALLASVDVVLGHSKCDPERCRQLLHQLNMAAKQDQSPHTTVAMVVRHLRLPPGSFPVQLSDNNIRMLLTYGRLPHGLSEYLTKFLPLADNRWRHE